MNNFLTPAQQAMVTADLIGYAEALATGYRNCGIELDDLKQEACYGLCKAVLHFDPTHDVSLKTFSTYYIKKYILKAIDEYGNPMHIKPEDREQYKILSFDIELERGGIHMPCDGGIDQSSDDVHQQVDHLLENLTTKERRAVECLFGLEETRLTVSQASKVLNVQPERVRKIYNRAMNKLQMSI